MKRLLILLALSGLTTAVACGDDSGDKKPVETPKDAGDTKPAADTGVPGARPAQVTNPGAACSPTSTTDCMGPGAKCETEIMVGMGMQSTSLPGGYCSAQCAAATECGPGGGCPSAEITALLPPQFAGIASGFLPSYCLDKCDAKASDCRTGYSCKSLSQLVPPELAAGPGGGIIAGIPALRTTYCLPPVNLPDAGIARPPVVDAGSLRSLDAGVDGGI
jgi:hypothetical protein